MVIGISWIKKLMQIREQHGIKTFCVKNNFVEVLVRVLIADLVSEINFG